MNNVRKNQKPVPKDKAKGHSSPKAVRPVRRSGGKKDNKGRNDKSLVPISKLYQQYQQRVLSTQCARELRSHGFLNPKESTKELVMEIVDFFDSTANVDFPYQQWIMETSNPFFNTTEPGTTDPVGKVVSCKVMALPQFSLDTASSPVLVMAGLPVTVGGVGNGTAAQQTTLLTPTSVSDWVTVMYWRADQVFADANITPSARDDDNEVTSQAVAALGVFNPDDYSASATKVQFMIKIHVAYTLPNLSTMKYSVASSNSATVFDGVEEVNLGTGPVLTNIVNMRSTM